MSFKLTKPNNPEKDEWIFQVGIPYEFTINFNDYFQYFEKINRHVKVRNMFKELLDEGKMLYWLKPEISMLQVAQGKQSPRLHYHGIIKFETKGQLLNWLVYTARKMAKIGRYQFNPLREEYWSRYCLKNYELFNKLEIDLENTSYEEIVIGSD